MVLCVIFVRSSALERVHVCACVRVCLFNFSDGASCDFCVIICTLSCVCVCVCVCFSSGVGFQFRSLEAFLHGTSCVASHPAGGRDVDPEAAAANAVVLQQQHHQICQLLFFQDVQL